jgi:hypothetical protein
MLVHGSLISLWPNDVPNHHATILEEFDRTPAWERRSVVASATSGGECSDPGRKTYHKMPMAAMRSLRVIALSSVCLNCYWNGPLTSPAKPLT